MKITINNEEVLSNKDFTINEEMLNTSSVILDNVYPRTWETDKDYVSRFYYPKDYSKCKIFNEVYHPEQKSTASGTSFTLSNVDTDKSSSYTAKGQTTQSGTPTPTSPVPINTTTGRQVVSVVGKNYFDNTIVKQRQAQDSVITDTTIPTGKRLTYTSSTTQTTAQFLVYAVMDLTNYVGKTIRFKTNWTASSSNTGRVVIGLCNADGSNRSGKVTINSSGTVGSFVVPTLSGQQTYLLLNLYVNATGTVVQNDYIDFTNIIITIDDSDTTYEEYKGNTYEINLGKNLFDGGDTIDTNGILFTKNSDGSYDITGTSTASARCDKYITDSYIINGDTYTFWVNQDLPSGVNIQAEAYNNNTWISHIVGGTLNSSNKKRTASANLTGSNRVRFRINVDSGKTINISNLQIQFQKGSEQTSYAPYKTPIELCKIGNYQDYIFKNTTDNPYYDSNLNENEWYIHKEVGKEKVDVSDTSQWNLINNCLRSANVFPSDIVNISSSINAYSNYFKYKYYATGITSNIQNGEFGWNSSKQLVFKISNMSSKQDYITWFTNNTTYVYYQLATPTTTLLEDEELINELESIRLLSGLNNVSLSSPDLPFIMDLVYNYVPAYTEEDMLFCGVVENTGNISLNPRYPHYCSLQVLDFKTFLSEGETLDFVIYEKTVEQAIEQVIGVIAPYGFVKGNINILNGSDVIGAYSTKDKTAYDVFNYIADITQSRWTTRMIDENTVAIDFYDPSLMPQGTAIEYTKTWFCNNNILDMSFSYSSRDYRNKQVMLSGEVYANIETTEVITADGYQTQFNTTDKIGYVSSIKINGNPATIITKEEYDLGYEGDFIYQPGNPYFESDNLVSTGAIITIVYYAVIEGREVLLNQNEIARINTSINRKGVVARYETRNDATTTTELNQIGQSYLKYKGTPEVCLKVETLNNIWNIGERVSFTAPLTELTTEYMVKKKSINYITTQDKVFYSYELTSSFNSETEINYFDNQRAKTMGNIGVGEYISRNVDIENTANIVFYDLEVNEITITGDSTLQSTLETPLGVE